MNTIVNVKRLTVKPGSCLTIAELLLMTSQCKEEYVFCYGESVIHGRSVIMIVSCGESNLLMNVFSQPTVVILK